MTFLICIIVNIGFVIRFTKGTTKEVNKIIDKIDDHINIGDSNDLFNTQSKGAINLITDRFDDLNATEQIFKGEAVKFRIALTNFAGISNQTNISDLLYPYGRF